MLWRAVHNTYIATWEGWAYLATVIDLASRQVVGWAMADHMRTELVEDALKMALAHRAPRGGLIFHSDRGRQYTSGDFAELARANGVVLSVGRKGECWDNAVAESLLRHHQARAHRHPRLADEGRTPTGCLRVHRGLVQHPPAALDARLPQPRSIRSCPPQRRPSGGIINTTNLSVEPDQAQGSSEHDEQESNLRGVSRSCARVVRGRKGDGCWLAPPGPCRTCQGRLEEMMVGVPPSTDGQVIGLAGGQS